MRSIFNIKETDYQKIYSGINYVEKITEIENSSVSIFDFYKKEYLVFAPKYCKKIGYDLNIIKQEGINYFLNNMRPGDCREHKKIYKKALNYLYDLPQEQRKDYKLIMNYHIRDTKRKYVNILLQMAVLELDRNGNIWLIIILDDILRNENNMKVLEPRLMNIKTGKNIYLNNISEESKNPILTERELEILNMISMGMLSKQIADTLSLSPCTINNHRQKILKKTNAHNISEAIKYAKNIGLL